MAHAFWLCVEEENSNCHMKLPMNNTDFLSNVPAGKITYFWWTLCFVHNWAIVSLDSLFPGFLSLEHPGVALAAPEGTSRETKWFNCQPFTKNLLFLRCCTSSVNPAPHLCAEYPYSALPWCLFLKDFPQKTIPNSVWNSGTGQIFTSCTRMSGNIHSPETQRLAGWIHTHSWWRHICW